MLTRREALSAAIAAVTAAVLPKPKPPITMQVVQQTRIPYDYPPDFYISSDLLVSQTDILELKYQDSIKQIMIQEDEEWHRRLKRFT